MRSLPRLKDAQLIARILRHLVGRPRRVEDDFDLDVAHAGKLANDLLAVGDELRTGGAHRAGHRHVDLALRLAFFRGDEIDVVDQSQIDDVHEQFGIDDLFQLFADEVFAEMAAAAATGRPGSAGLGGLRRRAASRRGPGPARRWPARPWRFAGWPIRRWPVRPARTAARRMSSPSTFTSCAAVSTVAGIVSALPVRMSNFAPCRGQAIAWFSSRPSDSGPAVVRADIVDAEVLAADAEQDDNAILDLQQHVWPGSGRSVVLATRNKHLRHEFARSILLSVVHTLAPAAEWHGPALRGRFRS